MLKLDVNRREFLKISAGAGPALAVPTPGHTAVSSKMIGIQVGAVSFVDEGTEKVLDMLQERACVNTLFLAVFTYYVRDTCPYHAEASGRIVTEESNEVSTPQSLACIDQQCPADQADKVVQYSGKQLTVTQ